MKSNFMIPTNKLRFVEKKEIISTDSINNVTLNRHIRVLQQLWESETKIDLITGEPYVEWRDVPLEVI